MLYQENTEKMSLLQNYNLSVGTFIMILCFVFDGFTLSNKMKINKKKQVFHEISEKSCAVPVKKYSNSLNIFEATKTLQFYVVRVNLDTLISIPWSMVEHFLNIGKRILSYGFKIKFKSTWQWCSCIQQTNLFLFSEYCIAHCT